MRVAILLVLGTMACAPARVPEGTAPPSNACDPARLGDLDGRLFSDALRAEALRRSGARAARLIRPGDMVTMDYRGDRLNIHLTAGDRVERFACG